MKREGKKGKGLKGEAYTIVGAKDPLMLRGDVTTTATEPEPEPEPRSVSPAADGDVVSPRSATRTAAGKYPVGTKVEVYSRSMAKWMKGVVLAVEADGAVKVSYADDRNAGEKYVDPADDEQIKLWVAPAGLATYTAGDSVLVYSRSLQKWVDGKVLAILPNGDVEVSYGDAHNQGKKCIDPADTTLKPKSSVPSSPAPGPKPAINLASPSPMNFTGSAGPAAAAGVGRASDSDFGPTASSSAVTPSPLPAPPPAPPSRPSYAPPTAVSTSPTPPSSPPPPSLPPSPTLSPPSPPILSSAPPSP